MGLVRELNIEQPETMMPGVEKMVSVARQKKTEADHLGPRAWHDCKPWFRKTKAKTSCLLSLLVLAEVRSKNTTLN